MRIAKAALSLSMCVGGALTLPCPAAATCDLSVVKVARSLSGFDNATGACVDEYFRLRDLRHYSTLTDDRTLQEAIRPDPRGLVFDDLLILELPGPTAILGMEGRRKLAVQLFDEFAKSLRGADDCRLVLRDGQRVLGPDDFLMETRSVDGQPGTRISFDGTKRSEPSWQLLCAADKIEKSGKTIFLFFDVYENAEPGQFRGYLASYYYRFQ